MATIVYRVSLIDSHILNKDVYETPNTITLDWNCVLDQYLHSLL